MRAEHGAQVKEGPVVEVEVVRDLVNPEHGVWLKGDVVEVPTETVKAFPEVFKKTTSTVDRGGKPARTAKAEPAKNTR